MIIVLIHLLLPIVPFCILGPAHQQYREMYQPVAPSTTPPPAPPLPPVNPCKKKSSAEKAISTAEKAISTSLKSNDMPIESIYRRDKMFMHLGYDLKAEWEALGRMLNVRRSDLDDIKTNNVCMVDRAVQMFEHWVEKNGSGATVGVLVTAVHNLGPQNWNWLKIIQKYIAER